MQLYMSNCIYGANRSGLCEHCHFAESILFPVYLYFKNILNEYESWHSFKMKTPKKTSSNWFRANLPPKSAFGHYDFSFKHQRENEVLQNRVDFMTGSKPLRAASCPIFWLQTTSPLLPASQVVDHLPLSSWTSMLENGLTDGTATLMFLVAHCNQSETARHYRYPLSIMDTFDLQNLFPNGCLGKKQEVSSELFVNKLLLPFLLFTKSQNA